MRRLETWLTSMVLLATALLLPMAALEPCGLAGARTPGLGLCDDGSAHLAMGCASILL
jgi:hypothetical protein